MLGGERLVEEAKKRAAEEGRDDMEELFRSMAKRGRQANLSFFAFTATPRRKSGPAYQFDDEGRLQVVAELVEVLGGEA